MKDKRIISYYRNKRKGSVLAAAMLLIFILSMIGFALLETSEGLRQRAVRIKNEASAQSAAEAGFEKAVFWMTQQPNLLASIDTSGANGTITLGSNNADYSVTLSSFFGAKPIYEVTSTGYSGIFERTIKAHLVQAIGGWEMGLCRVPGSSTGTYPVNFVTGENIDMPLHINKQNDSPDAADIYISGTPTFHDYVSMGEDRYSDGGTDKFSSIIDVFSNGIAFNQPSSRIVEGSTIESRIEQFRQSTAADYQFTPQVNSSIPGTYTMPAVQLEFYVDSSGNGNVRITEDCTVVGYRRSGDTWDYMIDPAGDGTTYIKYPVYGYHYIPGDSSKRYSVRIDDPSESIYVTQDFSGVESEPGAQIYIDGNVIIGSKEEFGSSVSDLNAVKGRITVAATGNIWIANELTVAGSRDADSMPAADNTNIVGLVSNGIIKVIDSGMTDNGLLSTPSTTIAGDYYEPVGNIDHNPSTPPVYDRELPRDMVVEAALTIGGGGWGAENVYRGNTSNDRENYGGTAYDNLIVRGTISEAIRGVVGISINSYTSNGYKKQYYHDKRLLTGILPGNIWLKGKYVVVPSGWDEYRPGE